MKRLAAIFLMTVLACGTGVSASLADSTEAIAVVSRTYPGDPQESAESQKPVLILLAVCQGNKWISGEELQKVNSKHGSKQDSPLLRQDIYDTLKGRSFVLADGSPGSFEAEGAFYSEITGCAYVMGCQGTRPVGKNEETVVVTRRLSLPKQKPPPLPKQSTFLPFARLAIEAHEQRDVQSFHDSRYGIDFTPGNKRPLQVKELKSIVLPYGTVLYWTLVEKQYEDSRYQSNSDLCPITYFYSGLFSGALPGKWQAVWESVSLIDCDGKSGGYIKYPVGVCDVNGNSLPEIVLPEDEYEGHGWKTLEFRDRKFVDVGSARVGL